MAKQKTMFGPAKHKYLSELISLKNPIAAYASVKELRYEFNKAKSDEKKVRIARATMLAANRAEASAKRKNLSSREKSELLDVSDIYRKVAQDMFDKV